MKREAYIPYLVYIFLFLLLVLFEWVSQDVIYSSDGTNHYFDFISLSAILGGFMFTSLSILLSISNTSIVEILEESGHMDAIYFNVIVGVIFSFLVIIFSILSVFIALPINLQSLVCFKYVVYFKNYLILLLIGGSVFAFGLSILDLKFIISRVRSKNYKKSSYKENKKLFDEIVNDENGSDS